MFGYIHQKQNVKNVQYNPPEELINCEPLDSLLGDHDNYQE